MKIGTTEKLKFKNLQRRLSLPLWQAVGLLESLWKAVYRNAPAGDLGRLTNDEIAAAIEWGGDADELVAALVETRWLDADPTHRLLVHDWKQECESWLHANFKKYDKQFAIPTQSKSPQVAIDTTAEPTEQRQQQPTSNDSPPSPTPSYPPPPSLSSGDTDALEQPLPADWEGVVRILILEGVGLAEQAVRSAIGRKCLASEALEVIRQWRELRPLFGAGMLKSKIENLQPNAKICWQGSPKVSNPKPAIELERNQRKTAIAARSAKETREANKREFEARAEKYGPVLDAMTPEARAALVARNNLGAIQPTLQRHQLLAALEHADKALTP